jgi:methylenetetrahydrofolate reductase (NADPH)
MARLSSQFAAIPIAEQRIGAASKLLLEDSSIELSTNGETAIRKAAAILPAGTVVYVPKMPRQTLQDKLVQIRMLRRVGLNPVPHVVARQLISERELRDFIEMAVRDGNVRRVLVIGGDVTEAAGPFKDSAAVISSGILRDAGIREIDVAGYPDTHPSIPRDVLVADLEAKCSIASGQGLRLNIVTQFSFSADAIAEYCADLADRGIDAAVYAGLVGPTSPTQLLRFARICGVSTSFRAANKLGMNALKLATNTSPDKHFDVLAAHKGNGNAGNLTGIHLFSFGGFVDSAAWLEGKARQVGLSV